MAGEQCPASTAWRSRALRRIASPPQETDSKQKSADSTVRAAEDAAQAKLKAMREQIAQSALKSGTPAEQVAARPK